MKLTAPRKIIDFESKDVYGNTIKLSDYKGRAIVLSFFRDASCPFCLKRVFELRSRRKQWQKMGVEVIAVFSSTNQQIRDFSEHPKKLTILADPTLELYDLYGVEHSLAGFLKALAFKIPTIVSGVRKGARPTRNPNGKIMPADFLIDNEGNIIDLWYGSNASDHIPIKRIESFIKSMATKIRSADRDEKAA